jgi:hypothetical protein
MRWSSFLCRSALEDPKELYLKFLDTSKIFHGF